MKLYWLDLETTDLDPDAGAILEVAIAEADLAAPFDTRRVFEAVLHWAGDRAALHPAVQAMHSASGLFDLCAASTWTLEQVEAVLLDFISIADDEQPTLAGSSVHFDRGFLRRHIPSVVERCSNRLYDVSSVKLFCRSLGMPKLPKAEAHRAMADIRESIEHARICADWMLQRA